MNIIAILLSIFPRYALSTSTPISDDVNQYWIGLEVIETNRPDNRPGWTWSDGSNYAWMNWEPKEPSYNEYVARIKLSGQWNAISASSTSKNNYICKRGMITAYQFCNVIF